tara:strand:- start:276 stop:812 length:537 start_codon:yes stop_codon:yes gene_type:complete
MDPTPLKAGVCLMADNSFVPGQSLPKCSFPLDRYTMLRGFSNVSTPADILTGFVGADCWAVRVKYRCHDKPIIEFNDYGSKVANPSHPDYVETIGRVRGDIFRSYLIHCAEEFLKTEALEWAEVYMFGGCSYMMKMTKTSDDDFETQFYGSMKHLQMEIDIAKDKLKTAMSALSKAES